MSRAYFTWQEAILRSKLEPTTKLVCHTIGCHMAADGSGCFPSYQTIADESGLNRSTVIRHVSKAVDAGFLQVSGRLDKDGDQTSNLYRPVMPGVVAQEDHPVAQDNQGGGALRPRVVAHGDPNYPSELLNEQRGRAQRLETFLEGATGGTCPEKWLLWAVYECKWSRADALRVFATFRDHWKAVPGSKGVKADWEATWRNWCRREGSFAKPSKSGEIKFREATDDEKADARLNQEYLRQRKLPENLRKSDDEIAKLAYAALYGSAA